MATLSIENSTATDTKSKSKFTCRCDPCHRIRESVDASKLCRDCSGVMRDVCLKNFYMCVKDADHHVLVDVLEIPSLPDLEKGLPQSNISEPCSRHKGKFYEAFCLDHSQLCCVSCLLYDHPNCKDKETLDVLATAFEEGSQVKSSGDNLRRISELLTKIIEKREVQMIAIEEKASQIVSTAEREIDRAITKLEAMKPQMKLDFSSICESTLEPMKQQITSLKALRDHSTKLEDQLVIDEQKDARFNFTTLLKVQQSFEQYQTALKTSSIEDDYGVNFGISLASSVSEILGETKQCYEIRSTTFKNWKDDTKRELCESVEQLSEFFVSMARTSLEEKEIDDTAAGVLPAITDTDDSTSDSIENNNNALISSESTVDVEDGHGLYINRKMSNSNSKKNKKKKTTTQRKVFTQCENRKQ